MRNSPTGSTFLSCLAAMTMDVIAVVIGFYVAFWARFDLAVIPVDATKGIPTPQQFLTFTALGVVAFILVFRWQGLYVRPHRGRFEDQIPRIVKSIGISFLCYIALEALFRLDPRISRAALGIAASTVTLLILLFRYVTYRIEWNLARKLPKVNHVLIVGADHLALRISQALQHEPFMRAAVVGYISTGETDEGIYPDELLGELDELPSIFESNDINQLLLCDSRLPHDRKVDLTVLCEHKYVRFSMVPDLFTHMTSDIDMMTLAGVPVIGLNRYPLDKWSNRFIKRGVDIVGALFGLAGGSIIIGISAIFIKLSSPGPIFYRQERCGENGKSFNIYKLRTMVADAESVKPGWTVPGDPRITKVGAFLRRTNLDEVPQFWNVLMGQMSVVGPRPERPIYVEQFKEEIERYMQRHVSRPGMTGWAQVNGLRGDTSIEERIRYDLHYLENWSLSFDFKIIIKTLIGSYRNAY